MTSHLSEDPRYEKKLGVELSRHGERSPEPYYDLVDGPNFEVGYKQLTETGAQSHYSLGRQVARFADLELSESYDPSEIYVYSSFKDRALDSARAQLLGLYDKPFSWPLPEDDWFVMNSYDREDDYILRADDDSCPRVDQIETGEQDHPDTLALYARVDAWLEAHFYPHLRELTEMPDADTETMHDVCDYIDWARASGLNLKFDLTDEDLRYISVADQADNYEDYAASPDQEMMATWELQQAYQELSSIMRGELAMRDARILTYYFPQASGALSLPKMIFFSGHESNVTPMLEFLNNHIFVNPAPASSVWVNFFECESCEGDERFKLEVLFCNNPRDLSECEVLSPWKEEHDGSAITNADFEKWLAEGLATYAQENSLESMEMEAICDVNYTYNAAKNPYMDTDQYFHDLLSRFGFEA